MAVLTGERIGNKTREEWEGVLMSLRRVAGNLLTVRQRAQEKKDKDLTKAVDMDYDALLNAYVLIEFVIENYKWDSPREKVLQ